MKSRYDFMSQSKHGMDPLDGQPYPDPLSVDYRNTQLTTIPEYTEIDQNYIEHFWVFMHDAYGRQDMDDVLLMLNNVPYTGALTPGDKIFLIQDSDLLNFHRQKQPGA